MPRKQENGKSFKVNIKKPKSKSLKSKKRSKNPTSNPTLKSIYTDEDGEMVDMTKLERRHKSRFVRYVLLPCIIILVIAAVTLTGFFVFNSDRKKTRGESSASLTLTTDAEVVSGDFMTITVTYANNDKASLVNTSLVMRYPQGFVFESADEVPNNGDNQWLLEEVSSGSAGQIKIHGKMIGAIDESQSFEGILTYKLSNFNYQFEKKTKTDTKIADTVVDIEIKGPQKAIDLQEVEYEIGYQNNANFAVENVRIIADYPKGFTFKSSEPISKQENKVWYIDNVASQTEGVIKISGVMSGDLSESKELKVRLGFLDDNNEFVLQKEETMVTLMVKPEIELSLSIDDESETVITDTGDILKYQLTYENISDLEIQDVIIKLDMTPSADNPSIDKIIDWDMLSTEYNDVRDGGTFSWTKESIEDFESLKPHEKGVISFDIQLKSDIEVKLETHKNLDIVNTASVASFSLEGYELDSIKTESEEVHMKINSPIYITSEGRYYTEEYEQVGSGPIPPVVGQKTTYRIYWNMGNKLNHLENVEIKTVLPKGVEWEGASSTSAGEALSYSSETREVTWNLYKVPPHTGTLLADLEAYFDVSITPTSDQLGKLIALTEETIMEAEDSFTGEDLEESDTLVTTDLENDTTTKGKGVVTAASTDTESVLPEDVQ